MDLGSKEKREVVNAQGPESVEDLRLLADFDALLEEVSQKQKLADAVEELAKAAADGADDLDRIAADLQTEEAMSAVHTVKVKAKMATTSAQQVSLLIDVAEKALRQAQREVCHSVDTIDKAKEAIEKAEASYAEAGGTFGVAPENSLTEQKLQANDGTMVTVVCVTYNHEQYIAEALDSFLMQKTNFKFKVFVGEDCGSDRTADIVREYAARYPDIVVPFIREKNLGSTRNFLDMCEKATSPYIAVCDGDDYWTDEYKLQKQFDYMEAHPDYRFCFAKTEMLPTETWPHYDYYKANSQGKYIMPDCYPGYHLPKAPLTMHDFINHNGVGFTNTFFFRWNYDVQYPSWFMEGIIGDVPLKLMQLGDGKAGYIEDVVSVYRINESGVFSKYKNKDEMFVHTRIEYIQIFWGMLDWYRSNHIPNYPKAKLQNRIISEANNLFNSATKLDAYDAILDFFIKYPEAGKIALQYYISANHDRRMLEGAWGWPGYQAVVRNKWFRNFLRPYAKIAAKILKWKTSPGAKKLRGKIKNLVSWLCYWLYTPIPKKKNLWIVSGYRKRTYMDNTRYFYEYVVEHHPEIEIYWLTRNKDIYNKLKREGKPVLLMNTFECICKVSRASIAVTDHYAVSDFERPSGFNDRTKVVQLWHGVGLKWMTKEDGNTATREPGVVPSGDILPQPGDGIFRRIIKKVKYIRHAYYRELFEKYFLLLTPGQQLADVMGHQWGIPDANYFASGYPRTEPMFNTPYSEERPKILYAPTYRWDPAAEAKIVKGFLGVCPQIQTLMEEIDGTFVLRMHPHTWRNYRAQLYKGISRYDRIDFDDEKDVYHSLGSYSIAISDYSSTIIDFALLKRPTIYFCPDFEEYSAHDTGLHPEFKERITGPLTSTWEETFAEVRNYVKNPEKDSTWASDRLTYFYAKETTDQNNSERIVCELKKRLHFKGSSEKG